MNLIEDWKAAHKWFSMQSMALVVALQTTWVSIPDDLRASVPPALVSVITIALIGFGMVGRLVNQAPKEPPDA